VILARPLLYTPEMVAQTVPAGKPGAYMLGFPEYGVLGFRTVYIGRSDTCLRTRLAKHEKLPSASHFRAIVCETVRQAFHMECYLWHATEGHAAILNLVHPASPRLTQISCPYCETADQVFTNYGIRKGTREKSAFYASERRAGS
jgi:hypothetical protein